MSSLSSTALSLDFPSTDNSGTAASWFRIGFRLNGSQKLTVTYNGVTVFSAQAHAAGPWLEQAFAIPYTAGASGAFSISSPSPYPDIAYLQRLDGPAERGGTNPAVVTGAFSSGGSDLALQGLAGQLSFAHGYSSAGISSAHAASGSNAIVGGPLGPKWWHTWQYRLLFLDVTQPTHLVALMLPGGGVQTFTLVSGAYVPPVGVHASLTVSGTT